VYLWVQRYRSTLLSLQLPNTLFEAANESADSQLWT
jgi:hypothetical protein